MSGKSVLLLGATGATGQHILRELLLSREYSRVAEYGRRVTPLDKISSLPNVNVNKLEQKSIDFEKINEAGLKDGNWDVVLIALGTTRAAAGSAAAFEKIDREYVVNVARAAKNITSNDDASQRQRLVYISSGGANASSPFLYPKSKGMTENELADLGYSDTIVFRPGYLANSERPGTRIFESIAGPLFNLASHFTSKLQIDVRLLGKAIARAGFLGSNRLPASAKATKVSTPSGAQFTLIGNDGAMALGEGSL